MIQMTILYELPQEDTTPVVKNDFFSDAPEEYYFGPDALTYDSVNGYWEFRTHHHPSEQSRSETTYQIRVPRHRVYHVVSMEPYPEWEASYEDKPILTETQVQRLVYENIGEETPRVVDSTADEILEPIRYDEESKHWRYRSHEPFYFEDGHTFTYDTWIPQERVYYALDETD
uniref:hypothetical protein n=1 Tax=Haloprofundus sp. MHR1 TaxID=2572921 RepID=UPI001F3920AF|nr:hypothetical protein [Haloprofundus sp. MHR1]